MSTPTSHSPAVNSSERSAEETPLAAQEGSADHGDAQVVELRTETDVRAYADKLRALLRQLREGGDESLTVPTPEALAERQFSGVPDSAVTHAIADGALVDTVGPSWSSAKLRAELGEVSRQALHQRVQRGTLLALPTSDGATVYPVFQFVRRGEAIGVRPGLRAMLKVLRDQDPWAVAVALRASAPELGGAAPVDWEKRGGEESPLVELAESLLREWTGQGGPALVEGGDR